jgi:hypothetical protein
VEHSRIQSHRSRLSALARMGRLWRVELGLRLLPVKRGFGNWMVVMAASFRLSAWTLTAEVSPTIIGIVYGLTLFVVTVALLALWIYFRNGNGNGHS